MEINISNVIFATLFLSLSASCGKTDSTSHYKENILPAHLYVDSCYIGGRHGLLKAAITSDSLGSEISIHSDRSISRLTTTFTIDELDCTYSDNAELILLIDRKDRAGTDNLYSLRVSNPSALPPPVLVQSGIQWPQGFRTISSSSQHKSLASIYTNSGSELISVSSDDTSILINEIETKGVYGSFTNSNMFFVGANKTQESGYAQNTINYSINGDRVISIDESNSAEIISYTHNGRDIAISRSFNNDGRLDYYEVYEQKILNRGPIVDLYPCQVRKILHESRGDTINIYISSICTSGSRLDLIQYNDKSLWETRNLFSDQTELFIEDILHIDESIYLLSANYTDGNLELSDLAIDNVNTLQVSN